MGLFVSHISGSRSPDSPYGLDSLLIRILYLLILLALWIPHEIQDDANENNKTKIITEFIKIIMNNLQNFETIYLKATINYHCYQMISKTFCQNKNRNLVDGLGTVQP